MLTTGSDGVDAAIIRYHGDWLSAADRAAVVAVTAALRAQQTPTREKTLELALLYGATTSNRNSVFRALRIATFEDEQAAIDAAGLRRT
jgi:hypothetical protein